MPTWRSRNSGYLDFYKMNSILKLIGEAEDFSEYEDLLALDAEQEKTLFSRELKMTPEEALEAAFKLFQYGSGRVPENIEKALAEGSEQSYWYAHTFLGGRFHLGEPAIATSAEWSYKYANDIVKPGTFIPGSSRFPLGEEAIASDARYSYLYALSVLREGDFVPGSYAFPPGEPAIATSGFHSYWYATNVLHERFPAGEEALKAASPVNWRTYKAHFNIS